TANHQAVYWRHAPSPVYEGRLGWGRFVSAARSHPNPPPHAGDETFSLARIRADFPILRETVRGKRLAYLDNAATTQKPEAVLQALDRYYRTSNANVHRAVHMLAERATAQYESARDRIARWFNATREEIVFTRGTTE